jgi:hypothetical protein
MSQLFAEYTRTAQRRWIEADRFVELVVVLSTAQYGVRDADKGVQRNAARVVYDTSLARKYERAARYPWLPVELDSAAP